MRSPKHILVAAAFGVALAGPVGVRAAPLDPANVDSLDAEAVRDFEIANAMRDQDPANAARVYARAGRSWSRLASPASEKELGWRQYRIELALKAFAYAYQLTQDCHYLDEGVRAAEQHIRAVEPESEQYAITSERRDEIRGMGEPCSQPSTEVPEPAPVVEEPSVKEDEAAPGPRDERSGSVEATPVVDSSRFRTYRALAISSGVLAGVSLGIALGTGLSRIKEPFRGAAFLSILNSAERSFEDAVPSNDVSYGPNDDMCGIARSISDDGTGTVVNQEVANACDRWDTLGNVTIAMGTVSGLFAASTIVLSVLAVREKHRMEARREGARLTVYPVLMHGGVMVGGLLHF